MIRTGCRAKKNLQRSGGGGGGGGGIFGGIVWEHRLEFVSGQVKATCLYVYNTNDVVKQRR
jgi:hypothetical protein